MIAQHVSATPEPPSVHGRKGWISDALDAVVCDWRPERLARHREVAREYALQFDRANVFDALFARLAPAVEAA